MSTKEFNGSEEVRQFVISVAKEARALISERLKDLKEKERWLVQCRIVNLMHALHFTHVYPSAEESLNKLEKQNAIPDSK